MLGCVWSWLDMMRMAVKVYPFVLCLVTMSQQIFAIAMAKNTTMIKSGRGDDAYLIGK